MEMALPSGVAETISAVVSTCPYVRIATGGKYLHKMSPKSHVPGNGSFKVDVASHL